VTVLPIAELRASVDAVVVAIGSASARDLEVDGRSAAGIHLAMEYLRPSNLVREGRLEAAPIDAAGKDVVIIGGGDTGADCLGTALRQGARSVVQLEIMPQPPASRAVANPWPTWPVIYRVASAHEEGGERRYQVQTTRFVVDDGVVTGLELVEVDESLAPVPGTEHVLEAQLVFLAMGFTGPERAVADGLGLAVTPRGNLETDDTWRTAVDGVFACGDAVRGQSLIVWAIAEGRSCAAAVDRFLMGTTSLPAPIGPGQRALV
jgi:glutamate synthase (NADPH/NADH) small chain